MFTGDPTKAIDLLKRSLRINPRDPLAYNTYSEIARAHILAKDYAGGLEWAMRTRSAAPRYIHAHLLMAMLQVGLGDIEKAKLALDVAIEVAPELVRRRLEAEPPNGGGLARRQFRTLLRVAAGLDDPRAADPWR
jgi:adenylate cyclase